MTIKDEAGPQTPPAVGEFAVQELTRVRARLAKYEDAEGNPITTIAEQAREIERLQLTCNDLDDQNERIYAELAAMKAQPRGVVLPPHCTDRAIPVKYRKGWNCCISEVARLNSSPVSSAPSHGEQVREVPEKCDLVDEINRLVGQYDHGTAWSGEYMAELLDVASRAAEMLAAAPSAGSQEQE